MNRSRSKPGPGRESPRVVKRPSSERKKLDKDLEAFARGDDKFIRRPPPRKRLKDPRVVGFVPGVANRDARAVFEARLATLKKAVANRGASEAAEDPLCRELAEAFQLGVWRGRSVASFDAFADQMLGIAPKEARELATRGANALGVRLERASDEAIATWMRAEAALLEANLSLRLGVRGSGAEETLTLSIPVEQAPLAFAEIARRMEALVRDQSR